MMFLEVAGSSAGDVFLEFINSKSIGIYMFIFFGKIFEVTLATIRNVLVNRGERTKGTVVSIFEVIIWVIVTGTVLSGFTSDIWKIVVFCVAYAIGVFLGSYIENKLALGLSTMQVISPDAECCNEIVDALRADGHAVTVIDGEGKEGAQRKVMIVHLKRNKIGRTVMIIKGISDKCVIAVSDLKVIHGGWMRK